MPSCRLLTVLPANYQKGITLDPAIKVKPSHVINNIRPVPDVVYARAGYDGQPLTVTVAVGDA